MTRAPRQTAGNPGKSRLLGQTEATYSPAASVAHKPAQAVEFVVPIRTVSALNTREHHFARHRRVQKERTATLVAIANAKPWRLKALLPCLVTLTRLGPLKLDDDAVPGSCKGIRDQFAEMLGLDDADPRIAFAYRQEVGRYAVKVRVERQ